MRLRRRTFSDPGVLVVENRWCRDRPLPVKPMDGSSRPVRRQPRKDLLIAVTFRPKGNAQAALFSSADTVLGFHAVFPVLVLMPRSSSAVPICRKLQPRR